MEQKDIEQIRKIAETSTAQEMEEMLRWAKIIGESQENPAARVTVAKSAGVISETKLDRAVPPDFG